MKSTKRRKQYALQNLVEADDEAARTLAESDGGSAAEGATPTGAVHPKEIKGRVTFRITDP